jgi:arginine decarboxylase
LRQWEDFFAYPGPTLIKTLEERIASGDATGTARLVQAISTALLTHSYRTNIADWNSDDQAPVALADRLPRGGEGNAPHRPYFEVLIVTPTRPSYWTELGQELRKLRRPQDKFVYDTVFVGSFEDAVLGTILNGSLESVVIYEGIPFESAHNSPVLREFLTTHPAASNFKEADPPGT